MVVGRKQSHNALQASRMMTLWRMWQSFKTEYSAAVICPKPQSLTKKVTKDICISVTKKWFCWKACGAHQVVLYRECERCQTKRHNRVSQARNIKSIRSFSSAIHEAFHSTSILGETETDGKERNHGGTHTGFISCYMTTKQALHFQFFILLRLQLKVLCLAFILGAQIWSLRVIFSTALHSLGFSSMTYRAMGTDSWFLVGCEDPDRRFHSKEEVTAREKEIIFCGVVGC